MPAWLTLLITFLVAAYLTLGLLAGLERSPGRQARRRLRELVAERAAGAGRGDGEPEAERAAWDPQEGLARLRAWLAGLLAGPGARSRRAGRAQAVASRTMRRLRRAGLRLRPEEFLALQGLATGMGAALGALLLPPALGALVGGLAGWWLPSAYVEQRIQARVRAFNAQLPDALTMIANAMRSGYSFLQAADVVAREMPEPIAGEFAQVVRETRVNIALEDALANLLDRVGSRDLDLFVTAVLVQAQLGGNLAEILDTIAETIRDRIRIQGQVRTLTAQGRMSGWIVGLLPVALLLILSVINREYVLTFFRHPLGWLMLGLAVLSEVLGVLVIRRIIQVEV